MAGGELVVALDVDDADHALGLVGMLGELVGTYKIGSQLLTAAGPSVVRALVDGGKDVFLDLKLHEIPSSVAAAVRVCGRLGVSMVTVHASAGAAVLRAAVDAADDTPRLRVLALTVITSLDDAGLAQVGVPDGVRSQVGRLADLAVAAGCHGLVCSPQELADLRGSVPASSLLVVPGVAVPGQEPVGDHVRAGTVVAAIRDGATHVVLGRGVTRAENPRLAVSAVLEARTQARTHTTKAPNEH